MAWGKELRRLGRALGFAARGLRYLMRTQPNARWHAAATPATTATVAGRVNATEAALLALAVSMVWAAEAFNTALEALADRCTTQTDPLIAAAKDTAAAAVLVTALGAVAVGLAVLGPKLLRGWRVP